MVAKIGASRSLAAATRASETAGAARETAQGATATAERAAGRADRAVESADQARETADTTGAKQDRLVEKANSLNVSLFQRFSRQPSDQDIDRLLNVWTPRLGLKLDKKALGYLAHRVCLVEDTCSGRLATSVQDELLRVLIAQSISGEQLSVLEIGTLFGVNLAILYETCRDRFPDVRLTTIDPLEGYYGKDVADVLTGLPVSRKILCTICVVWTSQRKILG